MITAVIIDDEAKSVFTLANFLATHCPQVKVLGTADNARTGKELIEQQHPQLVFLDIEMPLGSGFDLLKSFQSIGFEIIFITAYNEYAITAFRFSALDYLLKPLRITELKQAVSKAELRINDKRTKRNYELLLRNMNEPDATLRKIVLTDRGEQHHVQLDDIMYLLADGNYTQVHTTARVFLSSKNLKDFEELLPADMFCRIHYGHMINIQFITKLLKGRGGLVQMKDGKELEVAVRRKEDFMKIFRP
jgi:two-component system LytT family response regulator